MKSFIYKLKDETGKNLYGFQKAKDKESLKKILRDSRYYFVSATAFDHNKILNKKVSLEALLMFTRRLSSLIETGIPILSAMHILWRQTEDKTMQLVISHIRKNLEEGKRISVALNDFPNIFPPMYKAMIDVAEKAGGLVTVLRKLTVYLEYQKKIIMQTKKATLYPIIILVFALFIILFMFAFVVPTFQRVLTKLNVELPFLTRMILAISSTIRSWPFILTISGLGIILYFVHKKCRQYPKFTYYTDSLKLKIPLVGHIFYLLSVSRFTNSFGMMIASGLPIIDGFEISKSTTSNKNIIHNIQQVQEKVETGGSLYESFKDNPTFPIFLVEMIGVGESSGRIVQVLENVTKHLDEEIEYKQNRLFTFFEPFLIMFVGLIVIITLLAIYLPIFSIWKGLTG